VKKKPPPPRKRKGGVSKSHKLFDPVKAKFSIYGRNRNDRKQVSTRRLELSLDRGAGTIESFETSSLPEKYPGLEMRLSTRWGWDSGDLSPRSFPLIDRFGKFTGTSLGRFACTQSQYLATLTATIATRVRRYALRHMKNYILVKHQRLLVQAAYYYLVSKNSWFMDRFLFLVKDIDKNWKVIQTLIVKFVSKLDDYNRFVYSQVSLQTNWLLFRGLRPRDKSNLKWRLSNDWRKRDSLSTMMRKGNDYMRIRAFNHASIDASEIAGPACFDSTDMGLKPLSVVFTRPIGRLIAQ